MNRGYVIKALELEIEAETDRAKLVKELTNILKDYDGKVLNGRIKTFIKNRLTMKMQEKFHCRYNNNYGKIISFYPSRDYIITSDTGCGVVYRAKANVDICLSDDEKFNFEKFDRIWKGGTSIEAEIVKLKQEIENINSTIIEMNKLKRDMEEFKISHNSKVLKLINF